MSDNIDTPTWEKPTLSLKMKHLSEIVQQAHDEFKREYCEDGRQVTLFYYKFKQYEIQPGQEVYCKVKKERQQKLI